MFNIFGRFIILKQLLFFIFETLIILGVVFFAISVRFSFNLKVISSYNNLFLKAILISVICQLCLYYNDHYVMDPKVQGKLLLIRLTQSLGISWIILSVIYYAYPSLTLGRGILAFTMIFLFVLFFFLRVIYFKIIDSRTFKDRVLIVGTGPLAKRTAQKLMERRDLGYEIVGFIDDDPLKLGKSIVNPRVIGQYQDIGSIIKNERIKQVIVALPDRRGKLPVYELLKCKFGGTRIIDGISFWEQISGKISVEELKPSWFIFSEGFKKPRYLVTMKRIMDLVFSVFGLLTSAPLFMIVALLIKMDSSGPVFYRQERVGEKGKLFTLLKFRTMKLDAENETGPVWAMSSDPRITRVGKILRKTRIDELPQMINVLWGEMSFVGPRPERFHFIKELSDKIPFYSLRHSVKPGITGWAQIKYKYGSSVEDALEKLQYDLYYIKNMSIIFDLTVLFQTIKIVMFGSGAR